MVEVDTRTVATLDVRCVADSLRFEVVAVLLPALMPHHRHVVHGATDHWISRESGPDQRM